MAHVEFSLMIKLKTYKKITGNVGSHSRTKTGTKGKQSTDREVNVIEQEPVRPGVWAGERLKY